MNNVIWLEARALELLHGESLQQHGGLTGLRDAGPFESALARPRNLHAYEGVTDIIVLAACYGVALARNHPFNDGNKRVAFIAMILFAQLNGARIDAGQAEAAIIMLSVADGTVELAELAAWLRERVSP